MRGYMKVWMNWSTSDSPGEFWGTNRHADVDTKCSTSHHLNVFSPLFTESQFGWCDVETQWRWFFFDANEKMRFAAFIKEKRARWFMMTVGFIFFKCLNQQTIWKDLWKDFWPLCVCVCAHTHLRTHGHTASHHEVFWIQENLSSAQLLSKCCFRLPTLLKKEFYLTWRVSLWAGDVQLTAQTLVSSLPTFTPREEYWTE